MTTDCTDPGTESTRDTTRHRVAPDETPSIAVVHAVAEATGRDPVATGTDANSLAPLAESVDPEALDSIFESRGDDTEDAASVEFHYADHRVTVSGGATVCVTVK